MTTSFGYDALERLTGIASSKAGVNIASAGYGYETAGYQGRSVRTWTTWQGGANNTSTNPQRRVDYSYDVVNQLTGETATSQSADNGALLNNRYVYDAMGNRTSSTRQPGASPLSTIEYSNTRVNQTTGTRLTTAGSSAGSTAEHRFDTLGNLQESINKSLNTSTTPATQTETGRNQYKYDDQDRLVEFITKSAAGVDQHKTEWVYDSLSRKRSWSRSITLCDFALLM